MYRLTRAALFIVVALCVATSARAETCRSIEVLFKPTGHLQLAVWIETADGKYVDTAFITRVTGTFGLANRPGHATLKSAVRFPYGRREMVLPVWAHARNVHYRRVVMGGKWGNSIDSCNASSPAKTNDGFDCDDSTIGYHFGVSSPEPFYCSPSGGMISTQNGVDVVSCASPFYGSKGAYSDSPDYSLYPPRADLTSWVDDHDAPESHMFVAANDLIAISAATPAADTLLAPIRWTAPTSLADGQYVLKVEASLESDFNADNHHPSEHDAHSELDTYGKDFIGQPSVVYAVPFTLGDNTFVGTTSSYAGYSDWDGATGTLHPPDATISTSDGTGAGRLLVTTDQSGAYRVKVTARPATSECPSNCVPPLSPTSLKLTAGATTISASFASAIAGPTSARFDVRYREGMPIDDASFLTAIPASMAPPAPGDPGSTVQTMLSGLRPQTKYYVAVRALATCDAPSPIVTAQVITEQQKFVTLNGCFIATAAYGTPLAAEIEVLRRFRDQYLLTNPLGRLLVASYYGLSPPLARALSSDEWLRAGARALIAPLVDVLR